MSSLKKNLEDKKKEFNEAVDNRKKAIQKELTETKEQIGKSVDAGKKAATSFVKKLIWSALILAILGGIGYIIFANMNYSVGSRAGELIKISEKGVVFKTYEGQLSLGGLTMGSSGAEPNIGNIWEFSVTDENIFRKMDQMRGKKVILTYKEKYRTLPWRGDSPYLVTDVQSNE